MLRIIKFFSLFVVVNKLIYILVHYKVELFDVRTNGFMPSHPGVGMHVEVRDPEEKIILSRVRKCFILYNFLISEKLLPVKYDLILIYECWIKLYI